MSLCSRGVRFATRLGEGTRTLVSGTELGHVESYNNIGYAYFRGRGVASNEIRASSYWGECRGKIQCWQDRGAGRKYCRALKHFMIAVEGGYNESLNAIKQMYSNGGM